MVRVSDVLRVLFPDALDWVAQFYLDRGSRLHAYMEVWCNNILHGYPNDRPVPSDVQPVVDWIVEQGLEIESSEERFEDTQRRFMGHPDLLATWKGKPCVFDFKFAQSLSLQNSIQLEVYSRLTKRPAYFIQCTNTGVLRIVRHKPRPDLWAVFLSALNVLQFQRTQQTQEAQPDVA